MSKRVTYFGRKKKGELTDFELKSINDYTARFGRWHARQIDLLTFSINLLFTVSVAVSGFILSNQDKSLFCNKLILEKYSLTQTTLFILAISATVGIVGLLIRLNDLRATKDLVKTRRRLFELKNEIKYEDYEKSELASENLIKDRLINRTRQLGKWTWIMFNIQTFLFLLAVWLLVISI